MPPLLKTGLTLLVLLGLVAAGTIWGWQALTSPLPQRAEKPAICTEQEIAQGEELFPEDITVSVFNASNRVGLAGRTMKLLAEQGFGAGTKGNAPDGTKIKVAEIWASSRQDPAAQLVKSYLGRRAKIRKLDGLGPGVTVVVGGKFETLASGQESVVAKRDSTVCTPSRTTV